MQSGQARERVPDVADDREPEAFRHDPDTVEGTPLTRTRPPYDGSGLRLPGGPDAAAQDDDCWRARLIVGGDEIAAKDRPFAEHPKCVRRDVSRRSAFGCAPVIAECRSTG